MRKSLIMAALIIIYIVVNSIVITPSKVPLYNELINPMMWIGLCIVAILLSKESVLRVKDESNKTQSLIIVMIIYIILYFLLGLIFGFQKTPYSKSIFSVITNVWSFGGIIFFQEFIRASMVKVEHKRKLNFILITILFTLANLSFTNFLNHFTDVKETFIYTVSTLIPLIVSNGVFTYLAFIGGPKLPIIYRLFITLPEFVVPILPNLDWFGTAVIGVTLPLAVFIYLNYVHVKKTERFSRRESKQYNPVVYVPVFVVIALIAGFVIGIFKYQPIAVLSGSMSPTFDRGDAVVVEKLNKAEKRELKKGDIIQYASGSQYVIHRIIKIENDEYGNRVFITKGDNNNGNDLNPVSTNQVVGKVAFVVKYIGYPSVWLSGMVS